jgi:hypothetical protein
MGNKRVAELMTEVPAEAGVSRSTAESVRFAVLTIQKEKMGHSLTGI